jgi:hypothetical protein
MLLAKYLKLCLRILLAKYLTQSPSKYHQSKPNVHNYVHKTPHFVSPSSSIGTTTLVEFRPAPLSLSILSRKLLQSAVASGTSNPQLEGEPGI